MPCVSWLESESLSGFRYVARVGADPANARKAPSGSWAWKVGAAVPARPFMPEEFTGLGQFKGGTAEAVKVGRCGR